MAIVRSIEQTGRLATVYFDDAEALVLRDEDLARHPLSPGEAVDLDGLLDAICRDQRSEAMEAALRILDRSARSEKQLTEALMQKGFLASSARPVVDRLRELRLLDDAALAARIIEGAKRSGSGIFSIRRKLLSKGIPEEVFSPLLDGIGDQVASALKLLSKYASQHASLPERELRRKGGAYLARHGFTWDDISAAFDRYFEEE